MRDQYEFAAREVLKHYPNATQCSLDPAAPGGGFSGARLWKCREPLASDSEIRLKSGIHCLRRWPADQPDRTRLQWIHRMLSLAWSRGCRVLPVPYPTLQGTTIVEFDGHAWEMTPWLPGQADFHAHPNPIRLRAALNLLAQFHRAVWLPQDGEALSTNRVATQAVGIQQKLLTLNTFQEQRVLEIEFSLRSSPTIHDAFLAREMIASFREFAPAVAMSLRQSAQHAHRLPLQPCIRDVWHDHVLFEGDQVTGIVDFGAMRLDSVATDIARLLGSMVQHDMDRWNVGLIAYTELRPLTAVELAAVQASHLATLLLSGMNWLYWLWVEQKTFDNPSRVNERVTQCCADQHQIGNWMRYFSIT